MNAPPRAIRVLLVEDQDADAELALLALKAHGLDCEVERVQDERSFLAALGRLPDIVLSDHQLPNFSGERALTLLNERGMDVPYIALSGELSSFEAVRLLRAGARDYIPKHDLTRLGPAVTRELAEAAERRAHRRERRLLDQLKLAVESSDDSIAVFDRELRYLYANPAHQRRHAMDAAAFVGQPLREVLGERAYLSALPHLERSLEGETVRFDTSHLFAGAGLLQLSITYSPLRNDQDHVIGVVGVMRDVSDQRRAEAAQAATLHHLQTLLDQMPVACVALDPEGRFTDVNPAFEALFGYRRDELLGRTPQETVAPTETFRRTYAHLGRVLAGEAVQLEAQPNQHRDGTPLIVRWNAVPLRDAGGAISGVLAIAEDLTERERAATALQTSLSRLQTVTRATSDVVWEMDCASGNLLWNENLATVFGHEVPGSITPLAFWSERVHPDDRERIGASFDALLAGRERWWQDEYRFRRHDGTYATVFDRCEVQRDARGQAVRVIGALQDISARKQAEEHLKRLAEFDSLTGLPNRNALEGMLGTAMRADPQRPDSATLIVVNLDRFKEINDSLGHGAGDAALIGAAELLRRLVPPGAAVARLGGDEFALVLPGRDRGRAEQLAECIIDAFAQPMQADGHEIFLTASLGIALAPEHGAAPELLLRNADLAMYRAKSEHRGSYLFYDARFTARLQNLRQLENDLHRAVERGELSVRFQPLVALDDRQVVGAEALLRWTHPTLGDVAPARFIPVAEETGLIVPLGEWVLREACREALRWQAAGHAGVRVSVNVSAHQLRRGGFADLVAELLAETGLAPGMLELELTETTLMQDTAAAAAVLAELKALGVQLALDDFGTGYSSLAYLRRFPLDKLKMDRSFVAELPHDPEAVALAGTIVAMAHGLGLTALAEGVETAEQARFLRDIGCEQGQGWCFAKALPADEFLDLLAEGPALTGRWRKYSAALPAV